MKLIKDEATLVESALAQEQISVESRALGKSYYINEKGLKYHNKISGQTKKNAFISGPLLLLFFTFCTALIVGWNIYMLYILIFPFVLILLFVYFIPLVIRGKYINAMATSLQVKDNTIAVETFDWFFFNSKHLQLNNCYVIIKENSFDISHFPANCKLSLSEDGKIHHIYLIRDFFDDWEEMMQQLKSLNAPSV